MANPSKAKGSKAEVQVRDHLRSNGYPYAERIPTEGAKDRGDIAGVSGVTIEVKACKEMSLAQWIDEARKEAANAKTPVGVVWHKRRGTTNPGQWYVSMDGDTFLRLLRCEHPGLSERHHAPTY